MFVKICGITNEADALLAVAMGADAIGFIFAPSKRQVAPSRAGDIAKRIPRDVLTVGVFKDESPKRVVEIVNRQGLGAAQLHGRETPEDTAWVSERIPRTMKVFVAGSENLRQADKWGTNPIMVDAAEGGSGEAYDYTLARQAPPQLSVLLAGGLRPDTVEAAILAANPWGVDVASGVESEPGKKEPRLVADFVRNAKSVVVPDCEPASENFYPQGPYDWESDAAR